MTPGDPLTAPSPLMGSTSQTTFATSEILIGRSLTCLIKVDPIASKSVVIARLRTMVSWELADMKPPVVLLVAWVAASLNSSNPIFSERIRYGSGCMWTCFTPPPIESTSATPGMLWSLCLTVQSASVLNSLGSTLPSVLRSPTSMISPIKEATGVM